MITQRIQYGPRLIKVGPYENGIRAYWGQTEVGSGYASEDEAIAAAQAYADACPRPLPRLHCSSHPEYLQDCREWYMDGPIATCSIRRKWYFTHHFMTGYRVTVVRPSPEPQLDYDLVPLREVLFDHYAETEAGRDRLVEQALALVAQLRGEA